VGIFNKLVVQPKWNSEYLESELINEPGFTEFVERTLKKKFLFKSNIKDIKELLIGHKIRL